MGGVAVDERERTDEGIGIFVGSGNVFADLGLPDPDIRLAKAGLSVAIDERIQALALTQTKAAQRMGITQPQVSLISRGRLSGFSLERLFRCLNALDQDVRIVVCPKAGERAEVTATWEAEPTGR